MPDPQQDETNALSSLRCFRKLPGLIPGPFWAEVLLTRFPVEMLSVCIPSKILSQPGSVCPDQSTGFSCPVCCLLTAIALPTPMFDIRPSVGFCCQFVCQGNCLTAFESVCRCVLVCMTFKTAGRASACTVSLNVSFAYWWWTIPPHTPFFLIHSLYLLCFCCIPPITPFLSNRLPLSEASPLLFTVSSQERLQFTSDLAWIAL